MERGVNFSNPTILSLWQKDLLSLRAINLSSKVPVYFNSSGLNCDQQSHSFGTPCLQGKGLFTMLKIAMPSTISVYVENQSHRTSSSEIFSGFVLLLVYDSTVARVKQGSQYDWENTF